MIYAHAVVAGLAAFVCGVLYCGWEDGNAGKLGIFPTLACGFIAVHHLVRLVLRARRSK